MTYPQLDRYQYVAIDTESTGLKWWEDRMFRFSLAARGESGIEAWTYDIRAEPAALSWLQQTLKYVKQPVFHNAKYDLHVLREAGVEVDLRNVHCTMIRAALIDENHLSYDLDSLAYQYLGKRKAVEIYQQLADLFGGKPTKNAQMQNLHKAPRTLVDHYSLVDASLPLELFEYQQQEILDQELGPVYRLEQSLLVVLLDMEHRGVRVDETMAKQAIIKLDKIIKQEQRSLDRLAGFIINPNPSGSIHKLFKPVLKDGNWYAMDGTRLNKTEGGGASIDAETLRRMKHPAAAKILKLRKDIKTRDTFLKGHILGHSHNGVIHANFNQTRSDNDLGTSTGRLSCNAPALQQIHKRDESIAAIVRAIFLPDFKQAWNCTDWSQMDFRIFAHYVEIPSIIQIYRDNPDADFHQIVSDLTGIPRNPRFSGDPNAKQINLGQVFGMGPGKLAQEMGLSYTVEMIGDREMLIPGDEAKEVFSKYHHAVPGIRNLLNQASSVAKRRGYVKTIMGRHIRFPNKGFAYKAGGLIFQGTAADCLKQKLVEVYELLQGTEGRLLLNVHDEFDTSLPVGDEQLAHKIKTVVECFDGVNCPIKLNIPIRSSSGSGPNWWEACK